MNRRAGLVTLAVGAVLFATRTLLASTTVAFRASDGVTLSAAWTAPANSEPTVLLVHSLSRTHQDWDSTADALSSAGFGVLALDLRGHGSSGGGYGSLQSMLLDVQAGLAWLKDRHEVNASRIGIAGMHFGATLAVLAAGSDPSVHSIALLSPASEFRGLRCEPAMRAFAARSGAALLVAGRLDPYAARSAKQLGEITPGVRDVRIIDETAANGRALLSVAPDLLPALVDWFRKTLL
jgi:alpha-beta hydrolase superfamily lysophospholipase